MKNIKKKTLIIWIIAVLFLVGSLPLFGSDITAALCGIAIAAVLGVIGYVQNKKPDAPKSVVPEQSDTKGNSIKNNVRTDNETGYTYLKFRVAGVTFKNGRKSRQTILRRIYWNDEPFDKGVEITLSKYDFEGEDAVGVYANGEQIGNIARDDLSQIVNELDRVIFTDINVYGGGDDKSYGAEISVTLK